MPEKSFQIEFLPEARTPLLIVGLEGWGNAMNISSGAVQYIARKLAASRFADIRPDEFYRYDESRPVVTIEEGVLRHIAEPGGRFYFARPEGSARDLVLMKAAEPQLRWHQFVEALFSLAERLGVDTIITLGSMYDQVLHSDRIVSGIAGSEALIRRLQQEQVRPITYQGPSSIHSMIHAEGQRRNCNCMSLWAHCPYYIQGATHYALLARICRLIGALGGFAIDTAELEENWDLLERQIRDLVADSPKLAALIRELGKSKFRGGLWAGRSADASNDTGGKVIDLRDFLDPK